jgi:hypothetical protein
MTGTTSGAGTVYPSGAPDVTPDFSGVRVDQYLVFCVVFCRSLFCNSKDKTGVRYTTKSTNLLYISS